MNIIKSIKSYNYNFQQNLINNNIYSDEYEYFDNRVFL